MFSLLFTGTNSIIGGRDDKTLTVSPVIFAMIYFLLFSGTHLNPKLLNMQKLYFVLFSIGN